MATLVMGNTKPHRCLGLLGALIPVVVLVVSACSTASRSTPAVATTTRPVVTSWTGAGGTTTAATQTSGVRTVLSPVGLNVRGQPSKSSPVVGTAAQGATLTVIGHVDQGEGWYQVKGATVTGYITDQATLSASGKFMAYSSTSLQFSALMPDSWTAVEAPPTSVVFRAPSGHDTIVATTAATTSLLGRGRSGYRQSHDEQVVVCGVTGDLVTLDQTGATPTTAGPAGGVAPERYLAQIHLTLDAQHALGIEANLADLSQLQTLRDFANSVSFAFPQCQQGTGPSTTTAQH